jgi:DNA adenine methylase
MITEIVSLMPRHVCYAEVFGGSGAILFGKDPSKVEIYNDLNGWLVNLYRMIRERPQELIDRLEMVPYSRSEYHRALDIYKKSQHGLEGEITDPVEKAALFFMLIKQSFNSKIGSTWSYSPVSSKGSSWRNAMDLIMPAHRRLRDVIIEEVTWKSLFTRYDSQETLWYLDPPYVHITRDDGATDAYEYEMSNEDHANLCWECGELKGMVILSGYQNDIYQSILVEELGWDYKEIEMQCYSSYVPGKEKPKRTEVLWYNPAVSENTSQLVFI